MPDDEETFTDEQVHSSIKAFLEYGEQSFCDQFHEHVGVCKQQHGYFSGAGFAARCLRWHASQLKAKAQ